MADIEIQGLDKVLKGFGNLSRGMQKTIEQAMGKSIQHLAGEAKKVWPVDMGQSRASLGASAPKGISDIKALGGEIVGRMGSKLPQAPVIEFGRRAGARMPPPDLIEEWAHRHGMDGAGFVIARAIARRGLPAHHILEKTARNGAPKVVELFEKALDKVLEDNL